jgi:hypothetical protein
MCIITYVFDELCCFYAAAMLLELHPFCAGVTHGILQRWRAYDCTHCTRRKVIGSILDGIDLFFPVYLILGAHWAL